MRGWLRFLLPLSTANSRVISSRRPRETSNPSSASRRPIYSANPNPFVRLNANFDDRAKRRRKFQPSTKRTPRVRPLQISWENRKKSRNLNSSWMMAISGRSERFINTKFRSDVFQELLSTDERQVAVLERSHAVKGIPKLVKSRPWTKHRYHRLLWGTKFLATHSSLILNVASTIAVNI